MLMFEELTTTPHLKKYCFYSEINLKYKDTWVFMVQK